MEAQTTSLEKAYYAIKTKLGNNLAIEPFTIVKAVDDHRNFWRPEKVNVLLLAESHVHTTVADYSNVMNYNDFPQLKECPNNYVRLVYCLGYGEKKLAKQDSNSGTPQFWKIFASCVSKNYHEEFEKILVSTSPYSTRRIQNKIHLLEKLKESGIWLVDASIVALYNGSVKPSENTMRKIIEISWEHHISKIIQETRPKIIIVIGKGVSKILEYKINKLSIPYVVQPQPNSYLKKNEIGRYFERYYELCNKTLTSCQ